MNNLTPRQIVERLNDHIVGQEDAKKAVALALRNRYRRQLLPEDLQEEIMPKNIIMIGPTGVGKTEIARRLARLVKAPFIKVEATKFTEVGYVGRDAESMIRELVETSIRMEKAERLTQARKDAVTLAEQRLLNHLINPNPQRGGGNPLNSLFQGAFGTAPAREKPAVESEEQKNRRERLAERLAAGELEQMIIEIEVEDKSNAISFMGNNGLEEMGVNIGDMFGNMIPKKMKKRRVTVSEAREIFTEEEAESLIDMDDVIKAAVHNTEQSGIVFLDEIDKIAVKSGAGSGPDVSREGVQRDILPIVEGTTVTTKYGPVRTDYVLFIAAGAFHIASPSDLIPELQGRFPIRVELQSLGESEMRRILVEPKHSLIKQYVALLGTEKTDVIFEEDALTEIAVLSCAINRSSEDIGARRLHTILERVLEEISFNATDSTGQRVSISAEYVRERLDAILEDEDLHKYII